MKGRITIDSLELLLKDEMIKKHKSVVVPFIILYFINLAALLLSIRAAVLPVNESILLISGLSFYNGLYIILAIKQIGYRWLAYVPILGMTTLIYFFMQLNPSPTNVLGTFYILVIATMFMRLILQYTAIVIGLVMNIYFCMVVGPQIHLTYKVVVSLFSWYVITALISLLIVYSEKRVLSKVIHLQKETEVNNKIIHKLAHYDQLTQLPNHLGLLDRSSQIVDCSKDVPKHYSLFVVNIDNFKKSLTMFGRSFGDELIKQFSLRLRTMFEPLFCIARTGGDEFILLLEGSEEESVLAMHAERLLQSCRNPFDLKGMQHMITCSIGISTFPRDDTHSEHVMHNAYLAIAEAKGKGGNQYRFFNAALKQEVLRKKEMESSFMQAMDNNEFCLFYQPKVSIHTKKVESYEALIRWKKPDGSYIPPSEFIPIAEETGYIVALGEWVIRKACLTAKKWSAVMETPFTIAINISPVQLMQPDFDKQLAAILEETKLDAKYLEIEVTETVLIDFSSHIVPILDEVRRMGIKVHLDDFGVGYSSLAYLKNLPIDAIKIDQSFIDDIENHPLEKVIVESIVSLISNINLKVVMEGVETEEEVDFLKNISCDYLQGYYFSKPLPEDEILQSDLVSKTYYF